MKSSLIGRIQSRITAHTLHQAVTIPPSTTQTLPPPAAVETNNNNNNTTRRSLLCTIPLSLLTINEITTPIFNPDPALAAEDRSSSSSSISNLWYQDDLDGFSITVPSGWTQGQGDLGNKPDPSRSRFSNAAGLSRVVAFYPESDPTASIAVTIKTPSADFTGLGSFGTAQQFGETLVTQMDTSYLLRAPEFTRKGKTVSIATLVNAEEKDGKYFIEYKVAQDNSSVPERIVYSMVCYGTNKGGRVQFYTVNGSCTSENAGKYEEAIQQAVLGFKTSVA